MKISFPKSARTSIWLFAFALALPVSTISCKKSGGGGKPADVDYYTCAMHPSVKAQNPKDKCPICSMDLVAVKKKGPPAGHDHSAHAPGAGQKADTKTMPGMPEMEGTKKEGGEPPSEFTVPLQRQQEIGVTYAAVEKKPLQLTVRSVGVVAYDRLRHWDLVTRVEGYVEKLFVASKGELVEKAQPLVTIYSPELLTTQREFFDLLKSRDEAKRAGTDGANESIAALIESAKVRMRLWNLTDQQIEELERTRKAQVYITLYSSVRGLVQNVQVDQGRKVMPGDHLVDVTDLSTVWVWAEFYQEELSLLQKDLPLRVTTSAYPGDEFKGKISVIDPFINEAKRVVRVRIDVENSDLKLRPDMFVDVELTRDMGEGLTIPFSAVLPTGKRHVVFVSKGGGRLDPRLIEIGRKYGDVYEVRRGLKEGERVVASGNFLIDAEAKVQGALKSW
ncbi:MAG: efflux RND transporter periplasmic adaptor subunit [Verrucomicrobia subdivision 3 bacterium]|nr:efflux RND transporter periplasmic adaptor subunit [Limisphaerales bacterium]